MRKELITSGETGTNYNPVVIENILPQIDCGKFPVKVIEGEVFVIQADIFSNGNANLAAWIVYKHENEENWDRTYLKPIGNDRWEGQFLINKTGEYRYFIKAWTDPIATWQAEISRRVHQYISINDMLPEGLLLLENMLKQASKDDKSLIKEAIRLFKDTKRAEEAAQLATSFRFTEWLNRYPDTDLSTESPELFVLAYRKKLAFSAWYTMFPRAAGDKEGRHGTFQDVEKLLPRIADMGFDVLHFPPIHPIGLTNRKGKNGAKKFDRKDPGSPFAVGDLSGGHEAIHPELGAETDFKKLIKEADDLGIEIALDLALQFSPDHPWVSQYPDWFDKQNGEATVSPAVLSPAADFNQLKVHKGNWGAAKNAVQDIVLLWAAWGVRVIRIVQPDLHPFDWWQQIIEETRKVHPEIIFYAGTVTRPNVMNYLAKSGFALSDSYFMWRNSRYELEQYINELAYSEQKDFFKAIFRVNTPDINPYNLQSGHEPQQLIRFFLAATLSGSYGIYGPVFEQLVYEAFPGKEEYWNAEKYELKHWDWEKETKITYLIRMINKLRKENPALQQTQSIQVCGVQNDQIMAYLKTHYDGNKILCVVNLDAYHRQAGMVRVPLDLISKNHDEMYIAHDLITDAKYEWKGEWNYVELDPHILPFHLLRIGEYRGVYQ